MGAASDIMKAAGFRSFSVPVALGIPAGQKLKTTRVSYTTKAMSGKNWAYLRKKAAVGK